MTVFGRDASNYDADPVDFSGLGFFTHKSTEGTGVVHDRYGARLNAARATGVPVLGAYHVIRTPGSGGAGSLAAQLGFWLAYLDAHTPWWRTHPHWVLQIDAEKWPYDAVSASVVMDFARLLVAAGVPGWKVTYASRGQYGDSLRGLATPLWNADYRGSVGGSYPGDGWTTSSGQAAGWAPYSGQTPALLQYTSTPYDQNAYRGSIEQLKALAGGSPGVDGGPTAPSVDTEVEMISGVLPAGFGADETGLVNPDAPFVPLVFNDVAVNAGLLPNRPAVIAFSSDFLGDHAVVLRVAFGNGTATGWNVHGVMITKSAPFAYLQVPAGCKQASIVRQRASTTDTFDAHPVAYNLIFGPPKS